MPRVKGKHRIRDGGATAIGKPAVHLDKSIRIADDGSYFEKKQTKRRQVYADAKRQYQNRSDREARRPAQNPDSITKILKQAVKPAPPPYFARGFHQARLP